MTLTSAPALPREAVPENTQVMKLAAYLFLGAFAVHLLFLMQFAASPFFWVPRLDALYHDVMARQILSGHLPNEPFFRAPAYGYFLAGIYAVCGVQNFWAVRLIHAVIGSASVVLLFLLGGRVFDTRTALVAAITMIVYGPLLPLQHDLHTSVLEIFFVLAFLLFLVRSKQTTTSEAKTAVRDAALSGLFLGLGAITRPNALVGLPLALLFLWKRPKGAMAFAACALLFPMLVTGRNIAVGHDAVFIASQGGINLFLGNRPESDGFTPATPKRYRITGEYEDSVGVYGQKAAEEALHRPLRPSEVNRYWVQQAVVLWQNDPAAALRLTGKKLVLSVGRREIRNNTAYDYIKEEWTPLLRFSLDFVYAGVFGFFGMVWAVRGCPKSRPLALFALFYLLSFVPFFAADRFRIPVVPILLLFAAHGIFRLTDFVQRKQGKAIALSMALLLPLGLLIGIEWFPSQTPVSGSLDIWSAGNRLNALGRNAEAETQMRRALVLDPANPEIWSGLGESLYYQKRFDEAIASFKEGMARRPNEPDMPFNIALCLKEQGKNAEAHTLLLEIAARFPEYRPAQEMLKEP